MSIFFILALVLIVLLGAHDFVRARRGLRTGVIEGLMIGFWGKLYSREDDPDAYWINICAGFFFATIGGAAFLWGAVLIFISILVSFGVGPWP